eukprot:CAMPEP_0198354152 /NCGR_PEP_ID=MMETSP1450-20131203/114208_1 /TAXON_ID=753684 ORGANISM="Madagascaria erythrocladiodes, Strain CCMP3234" /NCGR_SAMPLE_ID=MMETSP1450 /ASSEMBLY_ACC=CAM_ASM_001115 /LENGTH=124 /DNA_ID=CAMNT_0044060385 /DNA_START=20 /DNA_END=391 /DNA_ORIENTATION=+
MFSIKTRQIEALVAMLNLNKSERDEKYEVWKVLVYDERCRDVIAPLMNVGQLREQGVTLHMGLHAQRLPVPDVPAVYFVEPTADNVRRIAADCRARLYDTVYVNFAGHTRRALLEQLAADTLDA